MKIGGLTKGNFMTQKEVYNWLKNLREEDVMDFGENYEGQNVFAIKSPNGVSCLTLDSFDDVEWEE